MVTLSSLNSLKNCLHRKSWEFYCCFGWGGVLLVVMVCLVAGRTLLPFTFDRWADIQRQWVACQNWFRIKDWWGKRAGKEMKRLVISCSLLKPGVGPGESPSPSPRYFYISVNFSVIKTWDFKKPCPRPRFVVSVLGKKKKSFFDRVWAGRPLQASWWGWWGLASVAFWSEGHRGT